MEPLWSPVVATGGDRSQIAQAQTPSKQAKPLPWVATGCRKQRMVRRGSTVRVRQRASRKCLQIGYSACPDGKRMSRAGTRGVVLMFARRPRSHADFGLNITYTSAW